jgi:hypothetical protein
LPNSNLEKHGCKLEKTKDSKHLLLLQNPKATNCGLQIQVPKCVAEENARNIKTEKDSD